MAKEAEMEKRTREMNERRALLEEKLQLEAAARESKRQMLSEKREEKLAR